MLLFVWGFFIANAVFNQKVSVFYIFLHKNKAMGTQHKCLTVVQMSTH